jgi:hypothetical protein
MQKVPTPLNSIVVKSQLADPINIITYLRMFRKETQNHFRTYARSRNANLLTVSLPIGGWPYCDNCVSPVRPGRRLDVNT